MGPEMARAGETGPLARRYVSGKEFGGQCGTHAAGVGKRYADAKGRNGA